MRKIILGAALLLLSGTAMAGVPGKSATGAKATAPAAAKGADGLETSMIGNAITIDWPAKLAEARAHDRREILAASRAPSELAVAETPSTALMSAAADDGMTGMGGPEEAGEDTMLASAPAASYRACSPGPGDDNCIQLYEPGVRQALASWEASRANGQQLAMGGPEEPLEGAMADQDDAFAAYEPLPEDAVMPASDQLAYTDAPTRAPYLTPAI